MKMRLSNLAIILLPFLMVGCKKWPFVAFTSTSVLLGETITFSNESKNAATYLWEFGDAIESTEKSPTHSCFDIGVYTVKLNAISESGYTTSSRTEEITVE
ncbi:MAG: PKD domain-containing protein [Crocinitomix sp.]|nr:PKD domain-containing protein [Crocinitomix sp.]